MDLVVHECLIISLVAVQELKELRRNGIRTMADAEVFETERRRSKNAEAAARSRLSLAAAGSTAAATGEAGQDEAASAAAAGPSSLLSLVPPASAKGAAVASSGSTAAALSAWRARRGVPLDITCLPGVELLSRRERELCAMSRLLPTHYLALKDMMLRECQRHGTVARNEARNFFRLDPQRCLRLYELWTSLGWVSSGKPAAGTTPLPPLPVQPSSGASLSGRPTPIQGGMTAWPLTPGFGLDLSLIFNRGPLVGPSPQVLPAKHEKMEE